MAVLVYCRLCRELDGHVDQPAAERIYIRLTGGPAGAYSGSRSYPRCMTVYGIFHYPRLCRIAHAHNIILPCVDMLCVDGCV